MSQIKHLQERISMYYEQEQDVIYNNDIKKAFDSKENQTVKSFFSGERTVYFHGVQLAKRSTETLMQLIDEKIKTITIKTNDLFDRDRVETNSLLKLKRQLTEHLFQWKNVELGDKVEYYKHEKK